MCDHASVMVVTHVFPCGTKKIFSTCNMWLLDYLLDYLSRNRKDASSASAMIDEAKEDLHSHKGLENKELEFDPFEGRTTLVYDEDGSRSTCNYEFFSADVAARLLNAVVDPFYLKSPVEVKYYAPDVKVYLVRNNRIMREVNPGFLKDFGVQEKGPVVLWKMKNKPRTIRPSPNPEEAPMEDNVKFLELKSSKFPVPQPCSASPPIPEVFRVRSVF